MVFYCCGSKFDTLHFAAVAPGQARYLVALSREKEANNSQSWAKKDESLEKVATGAPSKGPKQVYNPRPIVGAQCG